MGTPASSLIDSSRVDGVVLAEAFDVLADEVDGVLQMRQVHGLGDDALVAAARAVEVVGRRVDALRLACAAEVLARSPKGLGADRLSARLGCRTPAELLARLTATSETTAARRVSLGAAVAAGESLTGEQLPARFPSVANALASGELGEDSARVIVAALEPVRQRAHPAEWAAAEADLVQSALEGFTADQTRVQATVWKVALDPDGVEIDGEEAMRHRGLVKVGVRNGLVRHRMELVPEISGTLESALAAVVSPKSAPVFLATDTAASGDAAEGAEDGRSQAQKRHDAFASLIDAAARLGEVASMGGAAPTVTVTVAHEDLVCGRGSGWIDGVDEPVPMAAVMQFACGAVCRNCSCTTGRSCLSLLRSGASHHSSARPSRHSTAAA